MGQQCQKCQLNQALSHDLNRNDQSDSDPEYDEVDEKQPQKPPSLDSKSNSTTFYKEQYNSLSSQQQGKDDIDNNNNNLQLNLNDGSTYIGVIQNGKANGYGKLITFNGDIYEGNFIDNLLEGNGQCLFKRGPIYTGQFKAGKPDGNGKELWPDGSNYEGEFQNGKKNGYGTYIWNQQSNYEGQWKDNMIQGIGKYQWLDANSLIMDNGLKIKCMEEVVINGKMENIMMDNIKMIENLALEYFIGLMVDNFKVIGKMVNNMGKESLQMKMVLKNLESGKMENQSITQKIQIVNLFQMDGFQILLIINELIFLLQYFCIITLQTTFQLMSIIIIIIYTSLLIIFIYSYSYSIFYYLLYFFIQNINEQRLTKLNDSKDIQNYKKSDSSNREQQYFV
ncbi:unnamed protein product [Paramecium sonneborni]|uniref:MORN repeat protein n=1 Tax=Paramecium sonneborni TaxID=65129 RepID=A0A8S1QEE2_9CILI|nr:unnamed protein product [Paramecium sonneborni]